MEGGWCVFLSFKAHSTLASVRMTWPTDFRLLHQLAARLSVSQSVSPVSQSVSPVRGVLTLWSSHDAPSHNLPASLPPHSQPPPSPGCRTEGAKLINLLSVEALFYCTLGCSWAGKPQCNLWPAGSADNRHHAQPCSAFCFFCSCSQGNGFPCRTPHAQTRPLTEL